MQRKIIKISNKIGFKSTDIDLLVKEDLMGMILTIDDKVGINSVIRESLFFAKQFRVPHLIIISSLKEECEKEVLQELIDEYYSKKREIHIFDSRLLSEAEIIEKVSNLLETWDKMEKEEEKHKKEVMSMKAILEDAGGISQFVNTYRKTKKPFSRKLDK